MNWIDYLVPFGTAGGGAASVYGLVVRPQTQRRKKREAEEEKKKLEREEDLDGIVSASGEVVTPRLVTRVRAIESEMKKVSDGQSLLEQRMDEANGTGKRTEQKVDALADLVRGIVKTGADVKLDLHADASDLAALTDQSKSDLLNAIHESKE